MHKKIWIFLTVKYLSFVVNKQTIQKKYFGLVRMVSQLTLLYYPWQERESPKITCSREEGGRVSCPLQTSQVRNLPHPWPRSIVYWCRGVALWRTQDRFIGSYASEQGELLTCCPIQKLLQKKGENLPSEKDKNGFSTCEKVSCGKDSFLFVIGGLSVKFDLFFPRSKQMGAFSQK